MSIDQAQTSAVESVGLDEPEHFVMACDGSAG